MASTLLCIAACSAPAPSRDQPTVNLTGFPPAFQDGYADGCRSAQARSNRRDEKRYAADAQYAAGWRDGLDICKRSAR